MEPDVQRLQEVVVVGYGVQEKRSLTGALVIRGMSSLSGKVAGLNKSLNAGIAALRVLHTTFARPRHRVRREVPVVMTLLPDLLAQGSTKEARQTVTLGLCWIIR